MRIMRFIAEGRSRKIVEDFHTRRLAVHGVFEAFTKQHGDRIPCVAGSKFVGLFPRDAHDEPVGWKRVQVEQGRTLLLPAKRTVEGKRIAREMDSLPPIDGVAELATWMGMPAKSSFEESQVAYTRVGEHFCLEVPAASHFFPPDAKPLDEIEYLALVKYPDSKTPKDAVHTYFTTKYGSPELAAKNDELGYQEDVG